jgi:hypothetical protein
VHKKYGKVPLKTYPNLSLAAIFDFTFVNGIRQIPLLNYLDYDKEKAKSILAKEMGWIDYGGHHYENLYSKFAFGWYQLEKFNIDKRKVTLSAQVRSGKLNRKDALETLKKKPEIERELIDYCIGKLGFTVIEFNELMRVKPQSFEDFFTSASLLKYFRFPVKLAVKLNFFTPVLYEKYFS